MGLAFVSMIGKELPWNRYLIFIVDIGLAGLIHEGQF